MLAADELHSMPADSLRNDLSALTNVLAEAGDRYAGVTAQLNVADAWLERRMQQRSGGLQIRTVVATAAFLKTLPMDEPLWVGRQGSPVLPQLPELLMGAGLVIQHCGGNSAHILAADWSRLYQGLVRLYEKNDVAVECRGVLMTKELVSRVRAGLPESYMWAYLKGIKDWITGWGPRFGYLVLHFTITVTYFDGPVTQHGRGDIPWIGFSPGGQRDPGE